MVKSKAIRTKIICIKKYLIMCYIVAIELYEKEVELYYTEKGQKF